MQMKLLNHKKYLINLNALIKEKNHTPRSLALLTADEPLGYGKMSHQTIYSILKGDTDAKFGQLQELARILKVKINKIISSDVPKIEIIEYFDRVKFHFVPRNYDQPIEVIYSLKDLYTPQSYKALFWNSKGTSKMPAFSIINMEHKNWSKDKHMQERLLNITVILQCARDGHLYYGTILKFNKNGTCDFQQWKRTFFNKDNIKFNQSGKKISYENMLVNEWELRKDCVFEAVYPQISLISLFDEDYKIEQIAI